MVVAISYSISPTLYAFSPPLIPFNVKFFVENGVELGNEEMLCISSTFDPEHKEHLILVEDLETGTHKHFRIKRDTLPLPKDGTRKLSDEEKAAFLLRIKKLLESEIGASDISLSELEDGLWELPQTTSESRIPETLDSVREQLAREVELGVINDEQAQQVIEHIQNGNYEKELAEIKAEVLSQQEKVEAITTFQEHIFEAVQEGTITAVQADEMLINLEKGLLDVEEGGLVFDLQHTSF